MKKSLFITLIISFAAIMAFGTIGVLAYKATVKIEQPSDMTRIDEEPEGKKATSAAELLSLKGMIISYDDAPEEMQKLMKLESTFVYNGINYRCSDGHTFYRKPHAFRIISKADAEQILSFDDLENCSSYEAELIEELLEEVMGHSTIILGGKYQSSPRCNAVSIFAGKDRLLAVAKFIDSTDTIMRLKTITYTQAKDENLLIPEIGEIKYIFEEEEYLETFEKILQFFSVKIEKASDITRINEEPEGIKANSAG